MSSELERELELEERALKILEMDLLGEITWNPKQLAWINGPWRRRCLSGANQIGKSTPLAAVVAMHATGRYPAWYTGPRFTKPPRIAVAGVTATSTRELVVDRLFGPMDDRGSGFIPAEDFDEDDIKYVVGGKRGQIDEAKVVWHDAEGRPAGKSRIIAFAYAQGFARVQGQTLELVAIDEAPPIHVLDELFQRTNFTRGLTYLVMSPQDENAAEIAEFFEDGDPKVFHIEYYGVDDADHLTEEHKQEIRDQNAGSFLYECRVNGRPAVVSGRLIKTPPETYTMAPVPLSGAALIGVDFPHTVGNFAAVKGFITPECIYVVDEWQVAGRTPAENAAAVTRMGGGMLPVAWPHDGGRVIGDGTTTAEVYRQLGCNMLPEPAFMMGTDGKKHRSVLAILEEVTHLLATGGLKIFDTCPELLKQLIRYRFKMGTTTKPKGANDHLVDALFKLIMMRGYGGDGTYQAPAPGGDGLANWCSSGYDFFNKGSNRRSDPWRR